MLVWSSELGKIRVTLSGSHITYVEGLGSGAPKRPIHFYQVIILEQKETDKDANCHFCVVFTFID